MDTNVNGHFAGGTPSVPNDLEYHDALPRPLRDYSNYSQHKLSSHVLGNEPNKWSLRDLESEMPKYFTESTKLTYGPEHPQAQSCQPSPSSSMPNAKSRSRSSVIADKYIPCGSLNQKSET